MVGPPFNIDITQPQDTGIVSQYPTNERTTRDNIKSWLQVEHDTNGHHLQANFVQKAAPAAPGAGLSQLYAATDGSLHLISGASGTDEAVIPAGSIVAFAGQTLPGGWLWCNAAAVSRTTFSRLFTAIGTTFGTGDGSTTFNVPDLLNRTIFGVDGGGMGGVANTNRLTSASGFGTNNTWATSGGIETSTIAQANLPNINLTNGTGIISAQQFTATDTGTGTAFSYLQTLAVGGAGNNLGACQQITISLGGSGVALSNVPPAILMGWIIKW